MAEAAQARMAVYNLDLFPDHDISKNRKEGEDSRHGGFAVNDEEWDVIDLEAIGKVSHPSATFVRMGDDYHLVATVDKLR